MKNSDDEGVIVRAEMSGMLVKGGGRWLKMKRGMGKCRKEGVVLNGNGPKLDSTNKSTRTYAGRPHYLVNPFDTICPGSMQATFLLQVFYGTIH